MDWYRRRGLASYTYPGPGSPTMYSRPYHYPLLPPSSTVATSERPSYYASQLPLYYADWTSLGDTDCVALSSYKEGSHNKVQVVHGVPYTDTNDGDSPTHTTGVDGFDFHKVAEISVDYPVTHLQWDPLMHINNGYNERLAASSEVLRLYRVDHEQLTQNNDFHLVQTHVLANNSHSKSDTDDINTFPPVTSFDWNDTDHSIIITASVDTTCTVWDLNRTYGKESAQVKTQLIAHDSEVFDVKFIHKTTNIFASVGNDGLMRVFDLRSLEHLTIIYEPAQTSSSRTGLTNYNSHALIQLSTSNIDQNYLATVGVNSNQVIVIDMRMPGIPVVTLDGSLGGTNHAAINSIKWHPSSNTLLTGGDDCQALVWDCNSLLAKAVDPLGSKNNDVVDAPVLAYEEELEVNHVCWRRDGDWMGVISGTGFQAVAT